MTVLEAIAQTDARRHNSCTREEKLRWLSQLDGKIALLIHAAHQGEDTVFPGYGPDTPVDTVLLVGSPFDEIYLYWLEAQLCYEIGEIGDYNSAIARYNRLYEAYAASYKRSHMPKAAGRRFLF